MKLDINLLKDHEIKIGAQKIYVKFVPSDHPRLDNDHGAYVPKKYTIYINEDDPDNMKLSTYLHEQIHAIEHIYTFEIDHNILNTIAEAISQVLSSNIIKSKKNKRTR